MSEIHIHAASAPFDVPGVARKAAAAISLADAMGLLEPGVRIERLDLPAFRRVMQGIARIGIGRGAIAELGSIEVDSHERLDGLLDEIRRALVESPVPEREWGELEGVFGIDRLAILVGVSGSSARRYRAGRRPTPDDAAERLHFLAMIVGDLRGAYSDVGVRRWFARRRTRLGDRTPAEILSGPWSPDGDGPALVRSVARSLTGSHAT